MFFTLLLLLVCVNVTYVTKIEDILICINNTNCDESTDSVTYTQSSKTDDLALRDSSNDTEEDNSFTTSKTPTETTTTSLKVKSNVTEQPELETTVTITVSPAVTTPQNDNGTFTLEEKEICECDLTAFSCDINCCCDIDCNRSHLSAFSHCQDRHAVFYDSRYCYSRNFIQRNNTPFILEKLANNLFCVLYDNLPSTYSVDNHLANEKDLWRAVQMKKYTWKVENDEALLNYNLSKYYQYGDILWKLHDGTIEPIELLQSGFTGICSFKKTLRYLEDWKGECIQNELTNVNRYLFPATFDNFTIISSLPSFNETLIAEQTCKSNTCLPIRAHYCTNFFSTCNRTVAPAGSCKNFTCNNIVKGLKYIISHNGTAGVDSVDVYFNIDNASRAFYQYFEVRYNWVELNETKVFARSGNPGYVTGKPIIVGASRANGSDEILFNRTDGFLTLPRAGKSGECDRLQRHIVAFGEDVKLRCSVKLSAKNFTALSCMELQNLTMHLLMNDSLLNASRRYGAYVSKLGNFTSENIADWSRIALDRIPQSVVTARTIGKRILCSGLITSVHLDVLYSILPKSTALTNHNILGIGVTFSKEEDISWPKCLLKNCTDVLRVDILSYVNFHDISEPSKYYFVGGPNLDITLPYDFFYPFLNSGSRKMEMSNILIPLIICTFMLRK